MPNTIKNKVINAMDDRFLDSEYIAFKAGISNHAALLALIDLTKDFTVVKHMGRYKLVSCPGDLDLSLARQTELVM